MVESWYCNQVLCGIHSRHRARPHELPPAAVSVFYTRGDRGKTVSRSNYTDNGLLAQLHGEEPHRILPHLQLARLKFSEIIYKPVEVITVRFLIAITDSVQTV